MIKRLKNEGNYSKGNLSKDFHCDLVHAFMIIINDLDHAFEYEKLLFEGTLLYLTSSVM